MKKKLLLFAIGYTWAFGLFFYWFNHSSYIPFFFWIASLTLLVGFTVNLKTFNHTIKQVTQLNFSWHLGVLFFIVLLAVVLRFYALTSVPILTHDEAKDAGLFPQMVLRGELTDFFGFNAGINNFFYVLAAVPHLLFSDPMIKVRFFSAFLGVLNVVLMYFVGEKFMSKRTGLIAAFFMAVYHVHIHFSRTELLNLFDSFYTTIIFLSLMYLVRYKKASVFALHGLVLGLGLHFYSGLRAIILVSIICTGIYLLRAFPIKRALRSGLLFIFSFLVAVGPIVIVMVTRTEEFAAKGTAHTLTTAELLAQLGIQYLKSLGAFVVTPINFHYAYGGPFLILPISILFVFGLIYFLHKSLRIQDIFVLSGLVVIPFFNSAVLTDINYTHRLMSLVPFIALVTAIGITMISNSLGYFSKKAAFIAISGICILIGIYNINLYFFQHVWTDTLFINEFRAWEAAKQIQHYPEEDTLIFFCGNEIMPSYTSVPPLPYLSEGYRIVDSCSPLSTATAMNYLYLVLPDSSMGNQAYQSISNVFPVSNITSSSHVSEYRKEFLFDLYQVSVQ